ncbi:major facilitator superfamily MFS_1 [Rubrobacter xylanophilus DSM 9941]|uniref:Putative proline/betaine transporter n=1 Tax=Rubrobacter xylanophilus (strain DSM 9941 / JCM 11954 / NBRC 16129 / PRD-1) TaxID=266117 RepID=Q1ATK6_RUBXD|nr:major facilitator superfamily MFS_1 [Rubrobacter xylanophilus DSM 9941]
MFGSSVRSKREKEEIVERLGGEREGQTSSIRQVALASFIGTAIEWYDFFLYGTAAALVFGELFFPEFSPLAGTLAAFATYAVGFVARPLGGIVFGHYGDRIGRKAMLVLSLLIMGVATFLIGLLPTYAQVGVLAPVLLVILRFLQGIGIGGEWGGAVLMAVEHSPRGRRGFYGSWPQMGVPAGLLGGNLVYLAATSLIPADWAWRIPFLFSIVLVAVGLFIRLKLLETPAFQQVKETGTEARMPILDVIRTYPKNVLLAMGMRIAENGTFYVLTVFVLSYVAGELGLDQSVGQVGVIIAAAIGLLTIPLFGALSDRIGRRPVYMFGAAFSLVFAFPFFWLLNTGIEPLIWLAIILGVNLGHDAMYGPQASFFAELFGTRVRYSGASLGYQLASVIAGGLSPFIATALLAAFGYGAVALYTAAMALITLISVVLATETFREDIAATQAEEQRLISGAQPRVQ